MLSMIEYILYVRFANTIPNQGFEKTAVYMNENM